jgi:hypothetical protein
MPTKRRQKKSPPTPQRSGWFSSKFQGALLTQLAVTCVYWSMGFPVEAFGEYCITMAGISTAYGVARVGETVAQRYGLVPKPVAELPAE